MELSFFLLGETLTRLWVSPFLLRNYVLLTPMMIISSQNIARSSRRPTTLAPLLGSSLSKVLLLSNSTIKQLGEQIKTNAVFRVAMTRKYRRNAQ